MGASALGPDEWALSRALVRYQRFDLSSLPPTKRERALSLRLAQWSPYRNSDYCVVWREGVASIWCWDAERIGQQLGTANRSSWRAVLLPETLLVEPASEGLRLVACMDGLEGQVWARGDLLASRWWQQQPTASEWSTFVRDAGQPLENIEVPTAVSPRALERPWARPRSVMAAASHRRALERSVYAGLGGVLLLASLWFGLQFVRLWASESSIKAQLQTSHGQASELLQARRTALIDESRVREFIALVGYPDQLRLMAATAGVLPDDGTYLKQWLFEQGRLTITLSSNSRELAGSQIIAALQGVSYFHDLRLVPGNDANSLQLTMDVNPLLGAGVESAPKESAR